MSGDFADKQSGNFGVKLAVSIDFELRIKYMFCSCNEVLMFYLRFEGEQIGNFLQTLWPFWSECLSVLTGSSPSFSRPLNILEPACLQFHPITHKVLIAAVLSLWLLSAIISCSQSVTYLASALKLAC